ncbi:hypothetical protein RQP46_001041 [Phenoliferia psychrophenolica]
MNAHHKKRSHRPCTPVLHSFLSTGTLALSLETTSVPTHNVPLPANASLEQLNPKARVWKTLKRIPFGTQLDLIVPNLGGGTASALPVELEQLVRDKASYSHCQNINLALLLVPQFLNDFVRKGSLVGLSLGDDEGEDVVCIDGRGRLILRVSKDTYEVLGLPGRPSAFGSHGHKFVIEINLRDPSFRAGKPGFERTKRLLSDWPDRAQSHHFAELVLGAPTPPSQRKAFEMVFAFVDDAGLPTPIDFPSPISSTIRHPYLSSTSLSSIRDILYTLSRKTTPKTPFVSLSLHAPPHAPLSHLSARESPVTATRKKPNGKKIKRGRGTGEEEEGSGLGEGSGWEVVFVKAKEEGKVEWCVWENV